MSGDWLEIKPERIPLIAKDLALEQRARAAEGIQETWPDMPQWKRDELLDQVEAVATRVYEQDLAEGYAAHLRRERRLQ